MKAGQTLALAGLIQTDVQTTVQGIPYLMDIPYLGVLFRRTTETIEEIELLIMVRPELAEALNCDQVPPVGPGIGHHGARRLRPVLARATSKCRRRRCRLGGRSEPDLPGGPAVPSDMASGRRSRPSRIPPGSAGRRTRLPAGRPHGCRDPTAEPRPAGGRDPARQGHAGISASSPGHSRAACAATAPAVSPSPRRSE